jgi:hypothetical protein
MPAGYWRDWYARDSHHDANHFTLRWHLPIIVSYVTVGDDVNFMVKDLTSGSTSESVSLESPLKSSASVGTVVESPQHCCCRSTMSCSQCLENGFLQTQTQTFSSRRKLLLYE